MARPHSDSTPVGKEPCPKCGSRDNLTRYSDGHGYCFGCGHHERGTDGGGESPSPSLRPMFGQTDFIKHTAQPLDRRQLTKTTCERYSYGVGKDSLGRIVQVADYFDADGKRVAQKVRYPDKRFHIIGDISKALPFGSKTVQGSGKRIFVTEGEIDAMSLAQVLGDWPVVSIASGAGPQVKKAMAGYLPFLRNYEEVVLAFDMDEVGREAAKTCAQVIGRSARIATYPLKDANDMLVAGKANELRHAVFAAVPYRPEEVVVATDMEDRALATPGSGFPWTLPTVTALTLGRRPGEVTMIGAGTGVGKTEFILDNVVASLKERPVAGYFLEQPPEETGLRIAGKLIGVALHEGDAAEADIKRGFAALRELHPLYLYDAFGGHDYDSIAAAIRHNTEHYGVTDHWLDHLTALAAAADDERSELERIMADLSSLAQELRITITAVSHLATPEGKPHEEGGRVTIRHFKGSRAIGFWSHTMFGLERDQQADDPALRGRTTLRILKCRRRGRAIGRTVDFYLDDDGRLTEDIPPSLVNAVAGSEGFTPETDSDDTDNDF